MCVSCPQQTKVYHHSCYNTHEAHNKLVKIREKVESARSSGQRKKAQEKEAEVKVLFVSLYVDLCMSMYYVAASPSVQGSEASCDEE